MFPLFVGDGARCFTYSSTGVDLGDCVQSSSCRRLRKLEVGKNLVLSNRLLSFHLVLHRRFALSMAPVDESG